MPATKLLITLLIILSGCKTYPNEDFGHGNVQIDISVFNVKEKQTVGSKKQNLNSDSLKIPEENLKISFNPPLPDVESEDHFRQFINALSKSNDPPPIHVTLNVFKQLWNTGSTDIADKVYKNRLEKYKKWISKISTIKDLAGSIFESIELGKCTWNKPGENLAKYGYWQCNKSRIYYHSGAERKSLILPDMINWGQHWYVVFRQNMTFETAIFQSG